MRHRLIFLSTLSLRRATVCTIIRIASNLYFYPRSPCGERRHRWKRYLSMSLFLSTLSLRRATVKYAVSLLTYHPFLSTLSLRRATWYACSTAQTAKNFYPRSPCGERPGKVRVVEPGLEFLSTLSLRRATKTPCVKLSIDVFLSTLSLRRATS